MQADFRPRDNKEYRLQVAVVDYLNGEMRSGRSIIKVQRAFPDVFVYHCYQGRSKEEGFFLKRLGVKAGVSDLPWFGKGIFGFLEIKADGELSIRQKDFKAIAEEGGAHFKVARTVAEVRDYFISLGFECKNAYCVEPALSKFEMYDKYMEAFKNADS